jgi:hypothetical protein
MANKTRLEDEFNLPPMDHEPMADTTADEPDLPAEFVTDQEIQAALSMSDKINDALREVRGMESHDTEMDEIAAEALESYKQLMDLGHNLTDMASGQVFTSATQMLKVALDARDSKVNRKLKQIEMMLKKESLDHRKEVAANKGSKGSNGGSGSDGEYQEARVLDRNELMGIMSEQNNTQED